jgi:excisionase family DNA binding protein
MEKLFTAAEVAELFQIHREVVYDEVKAGRLKAVRIGRGRNLRFRRQDLDAYLDLTAA